MCALFSRLLCGLALSLTACGATQYEQVKPWFRIATSPRHVIAPHAIEWGGSQTPEVLVDGDWSELPHGGMRSFREHAMKDAVAVWDELGVHVYREGVLEPVFFLSQETCPTPHFTETEIACFACGDSPGKVHPMHEGSCATVRLDRFAVTGKLLERRALASPIVAPEVEGQLPTGEWIFAETQHNPDFLFFYGPRVRFQLDARGLVELPFGSDPLKREIDAAGRAREILEQVPIRDAALASLRAQHAEYEASRAGWVLEDETATRLRAGVRIEPQVPVRWGRCYTAVARSTPDLSSLAVDARREFAVLPESLAHADDPPLARSQGASFATVAWCVGRGDPPLLAFRIEALEGGGYLVARIYSYAAEAALGRDPGSQGLRGAALVATK